MILVSDLCVFYHRSMAQRKLPIVNPVCSASAVNLANNRLEYQHSMSIHRRHLLRIVADKNSQQCTLTDRFETVLFEIVLFLRL
jgi:hypothetical protein